MGNEEQHLENLKEIRTLMERSSRFQPLSGGAGIVMGLIALAGLASFHIITGTSVSEAMDLRDMMMPEGEYDQGLLTSLLLIASAMLVFAIITAAWMTYRRAMKLGLPVWDSSARRMTINLAFMLTTGGLFCLALLYHRYPEWLAPASLTFYGISLYATGRYAIETLRYLGMAISTLGIIAAFVPQYGQLLWGAGFGFAHI
ncbi:MAG: hypothetical protein RL220_1291, partial [Bacteroidota bacterium]